MLPLLRLGFLLLACSPALVDAQEPASSRDRRDVSLGPVFGLHLGGPQRVAVAAGIQRAVSSGIDGYSARIAAVEVGRGGGKLVVGLAGGTPVTFGQLRGVVLHTWGEPRELAAGQTYAGAEVRLTMGVTLGLGAYLRLVGEAPGDQQMFAATIGFGY